jgi:uncharacterized protein involved in exopolysaccharide biosynthesis
MRELSFLDLMRVVVARRRSILVILLVSVAASFLLSAVFPPVYEVTMHCLMPRKAPAAGIHQSPSAEIMRPLLPMAGDTEVGSITDLLALKSVKEVAQEIAGEPISTKTADIDVEDTGIVTITAYVRKLEDGQTTVLRMYDSINSLFRKISLDNNRRVREFIEKELETVVNRRERAEQELLEYHRQQEIVNLDQELQLLVAKRSTFANRIDQTLVALRESNGRLATLREELRRAEIEIGNEQLAESPVITELRRKIAEKEVVLATSGQELTTSHPTIASAEAALQELRQLLHDEIERTLKVETQGLNSIQSSIQSSYINERVNNEALRAERDALEEVFNTLNEAAINAPATRVAMQRLTEDVARDRKIEQSLQAQLEEVKVQGVREMTTFEIIDGPNAPTEPRYPNIIGNILVSLALALVVSLVYCVLIERSDLERERAVQSVVFLDQALLESMHQDNSGLAS